MPADLRKARELFLHAVGKLPPEQWDSYISEACSGDVELEQHVGRLLRAHREAGSFLDQPAAALGATGEFTSLPAEEVAVVSLRERPGTIIGPYKLLQQLGEGGMGTVFMAEQTHPVQRKVALKVIKPGMDSRQVIARFEAERQALAMMDHVNIARVFDAGATETGLPYFVMELVHGVPITKYCDDNHLNPRERLELFVPVCQAIQHAHQKGIIHRDIKPSNVMITLYDGKPVSKVIDFGVAKATEQRLTERTLFTQYGTMVGTLEYMSPEQAEMSALGVDTRSDIFSLGVLLYELLTGSTPLSHKRVREAAYGEILRMIKEEEPPRPSTRLSDSGEALASISAQRHTEPAKLTRLVRGELDWIVMKTLEKDRNRRYETANAFAADLLHYLHDEPVQACPPSATYRLGKFARRNRVAITTAMLVASVLVLGTTVSTWQAIRAEKARAAETKQRKIAEAERSEAEKQRALAEANFQKARKAVDEYFTLVSESKLLDFPGMQPLRKELLEAALRYYKAMLDERGDDPAVLADLAVTHLYTSVVYHELDRNDDCLAATESALELVERLRRDYPHAVEQHRRLAGYWKVHRSARAQTEMPRDPAAAHRTLSRFLQLWETCARENPSVEAFQNDIAAINGALAALEGGRGAAGEPAAFSRGADYCRKAVAIWERLSDAHPDVPIYLENLTKVSAALAWLLRCAGQTDQAREATVRATALKEKLNNPVPNVPMHHTAVARELTRVAHNLGGRQPHEAEKAYREALRAWQKLMIDFPTAHEYNLEIAQARFKLAALLVGPLKRPKDALQVSREGIEQIEKLVAEHPGEPRYRKDLAQATGEFGRLFGEFKDQLGDAEEFHRESLAQWRVLAKRSPHIPSYAEQAGHSYRYLGWITRDTRRPDDATANFEKGVATFQRLADSSIPQRNGYYREYQAATLHELAFVLATSGHTQEAENAYRRGMELAEALVLQSPGKRVNADCWVAATANWATFETSRGNDSAGKEAVGKLLVTLEAQVEEHPKDRMTRTRLAILGHMVAQQRIVQGSDLPEAERLCRQTSLLYGDLADEFPLEFWYREQSGWSFRNLGEIAQRDGRLDLARQDYEKAVHAFAKVAANKDVPQRGGWYRGWEADSLTQLAQVLTSAGRADDAGQAIRRGALTYDSLIRDYPGNADYRRKAASSVRALAGLFAKQNKLPQASAEAQKAARLAPDEVANHEFLFDLLTRIGDKAQTLVVLRENVRLMPSCAPAHYCLGIALKDQQLIDAAEASIEKAVELKPDYVFQRAHHHHNQAEALRARGLPEAVAQEYRRALILEEKLVACTPANADYRFQLARSDMGLAAILSASNQPQEAESVYGQVLVILEKLAAELPANASYRMELGHTLWQLGYLASAAGRQDAAERSHRRALAVFEKLATDLPTVPFYRQEVAFSNWNLGGLLRTTGRLQDAEVPLGQAVVMHAKLTADYPDDPEYRARLMRSYIGVIDVLLPQGKQALAEEAIHQAINKYDELTAARPAVAGYFRSRAYFQFQLAQMQASANRAGEAEKAYRDAINSYETIIARFPQDENLWPVYRNLADSFAATNRLDEANEASHKAVQSAGKNVTALNSLAWTFATSENLRLRNPVLAVEAAQKCVEMAPKDATIWNTLGVAKYRAGKWDDAIVALTKAETLAPGKSLGFNGFFLSMAHWRLAHKDEARKWYDQAVAWMDKNQPTNKELRSFRHEAAEQLGVNDKKD